MRLVQIADMARSNGWASVLREMVFLHRTAIVVEKDLSEITDRPELLANSKMQVVEIDRNMLFSGAYRFALRSRKLKALHNVERGYCGLALVRDNVVIGDTWYWVSKSTDNPRLWHVDLRRFGFKSWSKSYVYTFDIFVAPPNGKVAYQQRSRTARCFFFVREDIPRHLGFTGLTTFLRTGALGSRTSGRSCGQHVQAAS